MAELVRDCGTHIIYVVDIWCPMQACVARRDLPEDNGSLKEVDLDQRLEIWWYGGDSPHLADFYSQ